MGFPAKPLDEALWSRVRKGDGCWEWTASLSSDGYGSFQNRGRTHRAHRVAYEVVYGPIPDGMLVCHHCDNPVCCRPDHLFLGTPADNSLDMKRKGRSGGGSPPGERAATAKLTNDKVREIRTRYAAGGVTLRQLAQQYGVAHPQILNVVKRRTWTHIE